MIRVLQVLGGLDIGGAESMVMNYYRNIDRTQIQFDFIIHTKEHQAFYDEVISLGGKVYSFPKFNGKNILNVKKNWNLFFKEHPDYKILHSHVRSYASIYLPIAKKHGLKTIIHSHSTSNGKGVTSLIKSIMQYPIRYMSDYFMGCSKEAGQWLFGKKVLKKSNYRMIPNGIDVNQFLFCEKSRTEIRSKFAIPTDATVLGHSGRFHEAKNHMFLLEVFKKYHEINSNSFLLIVGDGDLRQSIEKRLVELNLQEYVIITGMVKNVAPYYSAMDIFVFPSLWEGLPVSVVESQAAGLPTIISNTITTQVVLSELVYTLPIDCGTMTWVNQIMEIYLKRIDVTEAIREHGFDVRTTADELKKFYLSISEKSE